MVVLQRTLLFSSLIGVCFLIFFLRSPSQILLRKLSSKATPATPFRPHSPAQVEKIYEQYLTELVDTGISSLIGFDRIREMAAKATHADQTKFTWMHFAGAKASFTTSTHRVMVNFLWQIKRRRKELKRRRGRGELLDNLEYLAALDAILCDLLKGNASPLDFYNAQKIVTFRTGHAATFGVEDLLVYYMFFAAHDTGTNGFKFLEIGADDGVSGSNTLYFERQRKWEGFLVEPSASQCGNIKRNRLAKQIRTACPKAVCRKQGQTLYFGAGQAGGTSEAMGADVMQQRWGNAVANGDAHRTDCDTMSGVVRSVNDNQDPPVLHVWSLDCEGCENVAIDTFDWGKTEVATMIVELAPEFSCGGDIEFCKSRLASAGMEFWGESPGGDQIWYSRKYFSEKGRPLPGRPENSSVTRYWLNLVKRMARFAWNAGDKQFQRFRTVDVPFWEYRTSICKRGNFFPGSKFPCGIDIEPEVTQADIDFYENSLEKSLDFLDPQLAVAAVEPDYSDYNNPHFVSWMSLFHYKIEFFQAVADQIRKRLLEFRGRFKEEQKKVSSRTHFQNLDAYKDLLDEAFGKHSRLRFDHVRDEMIKEWGHDANSYGTDLLIYFLFFSSHDDTDGSFAFLDVGAGNGIKDSSTLFLETHRRWTGFIVEPEAKFRSELLKNRNQTDSHIACPTSVCARLAKCQSMANTLKNMNLGVDPPIIHFWSLHLKGYELDAINTFDWGKTRVAVVLIQMDKKVSDPPKCRAALEQHGMVFWGTPRPTNLARDRTDDHITEIWYNPAYFNDPRRQLPIKPRDSALGRGLAGRAPPKVKKNVANPTVNPGANERDDPSGVPFDVLAAQWLQDFEKLCEFQRSAVSGTFLDQYGKLKDKWNQLKSIPLR